MFKMADCHVLVCMLCCLAVIVQGTDYDADLPISLMERFESLERQVLEQQIRLAEQGAELKDMKQLTETQNKGLQQQDKTIQELLAWKHQQADKEKTLIDLIEQHKTELDEMRVIVNQWNGNMEDKTGTLERLLAMKQDQFRQEEMDEQNDSEEHTKELNSNSGDSKSTLGAFKQGPSMTKRLVLDSSDTVAFHAVSSASKIHLGIRQKIIFENVNLNLGAGYHNQAGLFIAPTPGIYIFSISVMSHYTSNTSNSIEAALVKNNVTLAAAYARSPPEKQYDQGSVTVAVQLAASDEVWVENRYHKDLALYGDEYTSFMGCMIFPL